MHHFFRYLPLESTVTLKAWLGITQGHLKFHTTLPWYCALVRRTPSSHISETNFCVLKIESLDYHMP